MDLAEFRAWFGFAVTILTTLAGLVGYVSWLLAGIWRELHTLNGRLWRQEIRTETLEQRMGKLENRCEAFTTSLHHHDQGRESR